MLNRTLATVALLVSLTLALGASGGTKAIQLDSMLRAYETAGLFEAGGIPDIEGDSHTKYLPKLIAAANHRGVTVVFANELAVPGIPKDQTLWGFFDMDDNVVYLNVNQSANGLLETLFHELGHALGPDELKGEVNGQVFAEALAAMSVQQLKLDTYRASFAYLQQFPERHAVILKYAKQLEALSDELVGEVR
jgi:hypothetical protein